MGHDENTIDVGRTRAGTRGVALSALLLGACTVTGNCSSDISSSVQHDVPIGSDVPAPPPAPPESPSAAPPAAAVAAPAGPELPLADALKLVADIAVTKLGADALAQRLAPFGAVKREDFPSGQGFKLAAGSPSQHVEASYVPHARTEPDFYEIALDFPAEPREAADKRYGEASALLKKSFGKPIPFKPAAGELPSAVWQLKKPFQLFLEMVDQGSDTARVHVGLSVSVDD